MGNKDFVEKIKNALFWNLEGVLKRILRKPFGCTDFWNQLGPTMQEGKWAWILFSYQKEIFE